ncbi:MAG: hypothetical protein NVSMB37_0010 [Candidatus Saccharimonadales bacterium]
MLNNVLQIPSATVSIQQSGPRGALNELVTFETTGEHKITAVTRQAQQGIDFTNEAIGNAREDYIRYTNINSSQPDANGKPLNFSKVIGIWGKTPATANQQTNGLLYNQVVTFGKIPFANLPVAQRNDLLKYMQASYAVNYDEVAKSKINGRPVYTYKVQTIPEPYIVMIKKYAQFSGLDQLGQLDPAKFRNKSADTFNVSVDVWSRQIQNIYFSGSNLTARYTKLGQTAPVIKFPTKYISVDELQAQIQSVQ